MVAVLGLLAPAACGAAGVLAVDLDGVVHPITAEIVSSAVDQAVRERAALLLIRLNTPGGMFGGTQETVERIVSAPLPVVTYVAPSGGRAASTGFFILQAGDIAAMAPGTTTGGANPLFAVGERIDPAVRQKLENEAAAFLRSITGRRGRNSALAEKAVLENKSFTETEALRSGLIEVIAASPQALLAKLDGRKITFSDGSRHTLDLAGATIRAYEKTPRQKLLTAISDPNVALVLLVVGALGIYVEFSAPGLILPGALGGILLLLGLSAMALLPVNWLGAALLALALALFALEAKVASHGLLATGGTAAMIFGAVLLVDSPVPELRVRLTTAVALALPFAAITVFLVALVVAARRSKVVTGREGIIGERGVAVTAIRPQGTVLVHGEYWDAGSGTCLAPGDRVLVTAIDGLKLIVRPASGP